MRLLSCSLALLCLAALLNNALAAGFKPKFSHAPHYTQSRLYSTDVGFESIGGTIACYGDFNNDKYTDVFVISQNKSDVEILLWNTNTYKFEKNGVHIHYDYAKIVSVSAVDLNQDGKLDFLVQSHPYDMNLHPPVLNSSVTTVMAYFGDHEGVTESLMLPEAYNGQLAIFEFTGDLYPDLLGNRMVEGQLVATVWINSQDGMSWQLQKFEDGKALANPHSTAAVDFDGDCMPDLFLDRIDGTSEIWIMNPKTGKYEIRQSFANVPGRGQVSFGDFDGDGAVDILFPVCYPASNCTSVNEVRVYYNVQQPICSGLFSKNCRKSTALCVADSSFRFENFDVLASMQNVVIFSANLNPPGTRLFAAQYADVPMTIRVGDYNVDRFVDLLIPLLKKSSNIAQTSLWKNVPCTNELCGPEATKTKRRIFSAIVDESAAPLLDILGAFGGSFFDLDESGTLDILVTTETTDSLGHHVMSIMAVTNNYFNDGYFVKTLGLNGLCTVNCGIKDIKLGQKPYGVNQHGAAWKYTLSDLSGHQLVNAVPQLPQSAYSALQTPYVLSGLGRPSNYIDYVYIGVSVWGLSGDKGHFNSWPGIIPNSQVVVTPFPKNNPINWAIELYISPSGALLWIAIGVVVCLLLSGGAIFFFQWREKKADEAEKKEREHLFSFNAM